MHCTRSLIYSLLALDIFITQQTQTQHALEKILSPSSIWHSLSLDTQTLKQCTGSATQGCGHGELRKSPWLNISGPTFLGSPQSPNMSPCRARTHAWTRHCSDFHAARRHRSLAPDTSRPESLPTLLAALAARSWRWLTALSYFSHMLNAGGTHRVHCCLS